jgi:hypothetical protein
MAMRSRGTNLAPALAIALGGLGVSRDMWVGLLLAIAVAAFFTVVVSALTMRGGVVPAPGLWWSMVGAAVVLAVALLLLWWSAGRPLPRQ